METMATNQANNPATANKNLPVDMERLMDLTGGEVEMLRELVDMYLVQTAAQLAVISAAIRNHQPDTIRIEAHSCGGASNTMGINRLGQILLELERQGKSGIILPNAAELCQEAQSELGRVKEFLAGKLG